MSITRTLFGTTQAGENIYAYRMENTSGAYVTIISYGCRVKDICVPDRDGVLRDVCLGYDTIEEYEQDTASFGAVVGRHANRIGEGRFTINGKTYELVINNGPNHLHGGIKGFHYRAWNSEIQGDSVMLTRLSPDGEEGYPGNLIMSVRYTWSEDNMLSIEYGAVSDQDTVFNTTNHTYFNLDGEDAPTALDHVLTVRAEEFTETDCHDLPTGVITPVAGTPFDFRAEKRIGDDIGADHIQLKYSKTYDHNFVLPGEGLKEAAILSSGNSGISVTCYTDQPGIQIYLPAGSPAAHGKQGHAYPAYGSVCLETQHYPNATNMPHFPSVILKAGVPFTSETRFAFSVK